MSALAAIELPAGYRFEPDPARLDRTAIHAFLANHAYWSPGLPRERMDRAFDNSLCIGVVEARDGEQAGAHVGFARAVTDRAHFALVADVHVLPAHRGRGIAGAMVRWLHAHPDLAGLRRWMLTTRDAHAVYAPLGYGEPDDARWIMQRRPPDRWDSAPR